MRVLAEYKYGSGVTITTPAIFVHMVSADYMKPEIILKEGTLYYGTSLDDSGLILQADPQLQLTHNLS